MKRNKNLPQEVAILLDGLMEAKKDNQFALYELFARLSEICEACEKSVVLMIDEVDNASNNQVFLDFLAQLRGYYLNRYVQPTFQSVILASVYDIKNIKRKIRPEEDHKVNSPWNIAADFDIDMSFSKEEIKQMLSEYENDQHTGMNLNQLATLLYDYTSGYPFLVSKLCKYMDEILPESEAFPSKKAAWTKEGFLEAERKLLNEKNTLFDSLAEKLHSYPELKEGICAALFKGNKDIYNAYLEQVSIGVMFGFLKQRDNVVTVANRIFETWLYNLFLTSENMNRTELAQSSHSDKNQFVINGLLNMKLVMEKFVQHFCDLYGTSDETFIEDNGIKFFLLYLRPIINGTGNYYIEAHTRTKGRTDVIVDYHGEQYVIEVKIWHGQEYNKRGETQLLGYLDDYHIDTGYMLSYNFNKNKKTGVKEIVIGNKVIIEAMV